jgi:hypothetical protein
MHGVFPKYVESAASDPEQDSSSNRYRIHRIAIVLAGYKGIYFLIIQA